MRLGLFGLPGAGKGTQAGHIVKKFAVPHVSTGDIFREIRNSTSDIAQEIREIIDSGRLVSDDKVTDIVFDRLSQSDCSEGFILDGYPRTLTQAVSLQNSNFALDAFLYIEVSEEEILKRLSGRRVCGTCGAVYNIAQSASLSECNLDGGNLIQRVDDSVESIKKRLQVFQSNLDPVLDFFQQKKLLIRVNGLLPENEVFNEICTKIKSIS